MDYEKKYKGALARCKWLLSEGMISKVAATDMFRELMDNDSENIGKEIINIFHSLADGKIPVDINYADIFTWLENIPYTIDHEKREGFYLGYKAGLEKQEQKPAWSEEDECYMGECIGAIATKDGWSFEEKRKTKHWLKSLKDRVQPKQEWSEEDENVLEDIEEAIINYWHGDTQDILLDWLKSLKDRVQPKQKLNEHDNYVINKVLDWATFVNPTSSIFEKLPKKQFIESLKSLKQRIGG